MDRAFSSGLMVASFTVTLFKERNMVTVLTFGLMVNAMLEISKMMNVLVRVSCTILTVKLSMELGKTEKNKVNVTTHGQTVRSTLFFTTREKLKVKDSFNRRAHP